MDPITSRIARHRILALPLLAAILLAACGSSSSQYIGTGGSAAQAPAAAGGDTGRAAIEAPADQLTGEASSANAAAPGAGTGSAQSGGSGADPAILKDNLQVVYTGSLGLVVGNLDESVAKARAAITALGGYVGASQQSNDGDRSSAVITYRIPASRWDDGVAALRALGTKVVSEDTQATEVGSQIVDLDARIRNLRASEQVLVGIAQGTGKVTDLLEVQDRISAVRGEIEQLEAQRARLGDQVQYGTLVTTFGLEVAQVVETKQAWDPATDVDGALATLIGAGQTIVSGAIWFGIVWMPVILVLLLLALTVRWLVRRFLPPAKPAEPVGFGGGS